MTNVDAGERREVERRFGACDDRAIPTQCAGGECRECHRSAQDLTGRRYVLANMSDREIAHALLNFFLLAFTASTPCRSAVQRISTISSRAPSRMPGMLCQERLTRWSVTRSCGKL